MYEDLPSGGDSRFSMHEEPIIVQRLIRVTLRGGSTVLKFCESRGCVARSGKGIITSTSSVIQSRSMYQGPALLLSLLHEFWFCGIDRKQGVAREASAQLCSVRRPPAVLSNLEPA